MSQLLKVEVEPVEEVIPDAAAARATPAPRAAKPAGEAPSDHAPDDQDKPGVLQDQLSSADRRRLRQSEALHVADALGTASSLSERIAIYKESGRTVLFLAASLYPELMPTLNGELEWIALLSADLD